MQMIVEETNKLMKESKEEIIKKVRELASSLGEEKLSSRGVKFFKLKYKGITIPYSI